MVSAVLAPPLRGGMSSAGRAAALRMVATLVCLALAWEGLVRGLAIPGYYLPPFSAVFLQVWRSPELFAASVLRTGGETLLGFLAGGLFGLASGILFVHARIVERMFFPFFVLSQSVPVIAFGALIVIWFGNGILAKVAIAFYLTFFPVTVSTVRGLGAVDPQQVALLRSFGARELKLFLSLRFPTALPLIFVSLRLGIGLSLIGAIVGEWFGDTVGLGVMLLQAMFNEQMPRLWATIVTAAVLGSSLYLAIAAVEQRIVWWREEL
jgi:NitT/TauT family transport system permease protein